MKFAGMAASPGVGVAPIYLLQREELAVRDTPVPAAAVEGEVARFHEALEASRADLASIRDRISRELSEAEAEIYSAHLMILDDPDLMRAVEQGIREQRRNAAWVFRAHMAGVAAHLAGVESEHLRERQADVLDVERRVLRHLLGDGQRALVASPSEPSVLVAHDVAPSEIALLDRERIVGIVTEVGSRSSHCAIVARGRGIPAVVSCRGILQQAADGMVGAVDGFLGTVELDPDAETTAFFAARRRRIEEEDRSLLSIQDQPAVTRDGARPRPGREPRAAGRRRARAQRGGRERRAVPHRVLLPGPARAAGGGGAVPGLPRGGGAHEPAPRCCSAPWTWAATRWPPTSARVHENNPFLGPARHPPLARVPRGVPRPAARHLPGQRPRPGARHVPDGLEPGGAAQRPGDVPARCARSWGARACPTTPRSRSGS